MRASGEGGAQIRVGTSGWVYPHWRGRFYPERLPARQWFEYYAAVFDTVEINNTFYRVPAPEVFDSWREQAPEGFLFAVKANRLLTHRKRLKDIDRSLADFLNRVRRLKDRLGPVLYQLPPRWKRNVERLRAFCSKLPSGLWHVVEFRDASWLVEETFEVLAEHGVSLCVHDLIARHPRRAVGPAVYVRFHGAGEKYGGCYQRSQLRRWAHWLRAEHAAGRHVFAYFNNDAEAYAVKNAQTLRELLA